MLSSATNGARPLYAATQHNGSLGTKVGKQYDSDGSSDNVQGEDLGSALDQLARSVAVVAKLGYPRSLVEQVAQRLLSVDGSKPPSCRRLAEEVQNFDTITCSPPQARAEDTTAAAAAGCTAIARASDARSQKSIAAESPSKNRRTSLAELIRDVEREADEQDSAAAAIVEHLTCKVCREQRSHVVLLPCGHLCCCGGCAASLRKCPTCGGDVRGAIKAYLS